MESDARIIRKKASKEYAQIRNSTLEDASMSYKALGILATLLAKPEDWECRVSHLQRPSDRRDAVRGGIRELRTLGYMSLVRRRDERGQIENLYYVYERPDDND